MNIELPVGSSFICDACGVTSTYRGRCVESLHVFVIDALVSFCSRRCYFVCLAGGGRLRDGRTILVIDGRTPAEEIAELCRRRGIDAALPAPRMIDAIQQIEFSRR